MLGPSLKQNLISSGNETFDKFLGGGLLNSSLNLFERQGPSSRLLDVIINKSFAATTLANKRALIYVNFNTSQTILEQELLASLPGCRVVKSELLYRDLREKSAIAKIKIAWRYSQQNTSSPSDGVARSQQIDFGVSLIKTTDSIELGKLSVINLEQDETIASLVAKISREIAELKKTHPSVNIIVKDLLHPFSPLAHDSCDRFLQLIYVFRCLSRRLDKGFVVINYDNSFCENHFNIEQNLYNLADCVVSFYSYETDENKLTAYKDIDGTLSYVKVPKISSFGFHFQQDLSDWGYRLTKNLKYFVIDELSLPPCEDDDNEEGKGRQCATNLARIDNTHRPLEQVGPLEEFRDVAKDFLARKL